MSAELPAADADISVLEHCFSQAAGTAGQVWLAVLERLPTARAQKTDSQQDLKLFVEQVVANLLQVQVGQMHVSVGQKTLCSGWLFYLL